MLTTPMPAACSPALPTRLEAGSDARHSCVPAGQPSSRMQEPRAPSHPCCPPQRAEVSCCGSSRAWAASKRIQDASHLAQWALLTIL